MLTILTINTLFVWIFFILSITVVFLLVFTCFAKDHGMMDDSEDCWNNNN